VVRWAVQQNLGGIENLALIPGTTGAAPIQNIGAYGVELESVFDELRAFDMKTGEFVTFSKEECRFGYRDSVFKRELRGRMIVTSVRLKLQPSPHTIVQNYYALKNRFQEEGIENPGIRDVFDAVVAIRSSKLPDPKSLGNAGSFFKNPVVEPELFHRIRQENPKMPSFPAPGGKVKIPAGWLIEQAGWKGRRIGNVGTYKNQALVIVNHGGATGDEIAKHADRIRASVAETFGIELVPEVNIIG
jgi:UDP-N-acetylmuramate dehydrogenase